METFSHKKKREREREERKKKEEEEFLDSEHGLRKSKSTETEIFFFSQRCSFINRPK